MSEISKKQNGFTLIELLLALVILGIILLIGLPSLSVYQAGNLLRETTDEIMDRLRVAHMRTIKKEGNARHGVHFSPQEFVLFKGAVYIPGDPENVSTEIGRGLEIYDVSLNGGGNDVVFDFLTGKTSNYGSIKVRVQGSADYTQVSISELGLIESFWFDN